MSAQVRLLPFAGYTLAALAFLKIASVVTGLTAAKAQDEAAPAMQIAAPVATAAAIADVPAPARATTDSERKILVKLAERRAALDQREQDLAARAALLAAAEQRLAEEAAAVQAEIAELTQLRDARNEEANEETAALISAYEKMRAKDAARIFDELDEAILLPVAAGMRSQTLAGVLAEMRPERARALTALLAERGKPPTPDMSKAEQ